MLCTHTSSFPRVVRPHKDLQGSRVGHTGQQLGQVGFRQQTFPVTQNLENQKQKRVQELETERGDCACVFECEQGVKF